MPPLEVKLTFPCGSGFHNPLGKAPGYAPLPACRLSPADHQRKPARWKRYVPRRFPLFQSAPEALERLLNCSLLGSKVHPEPKQFHPLGKNLLENVPEKGIDLERAGTCNPDGHLLSQRAESVFANRDIATLCGESFKSQQVIIGL